MKNDKLITTIRYDNKYPVRMTYDFNNLSVWLEYYANGQYEKQKIRNISTFTNTKQTKIKKIIKKT